jgi:hypothetical protein
VPPESEAGVVYSRDVLYCQSTQLQFIRLCMKGANSHVTRWQNRQDKGTYMMCRVTKRDSGEPQHVGCEVPVLEPQAANIRHVTTGNRLELSSRRSYTAVVIVEEWA